MNILKKMIEDNIASNYLHAERIANGLRLSEVADDQAKIERYKLYRKWRNAGVSAKAGFANAIAGLEPMQTLTSDFPKVSVPKR